MSRGIWRTLGIEPTTDRSAIRRAYATRLRAMDVDADPAGFARLRDARDAALTGVDDPVAVPDEPDDVAVIAEAYVDPVDVGHNAEIERRFRALEALLFPGHDDPPTPAEAVAIRQHGTALLADPRLEQVDFAVGAERWFAEHLCLATPRADPMLEQAAATFGWIERRDDHALSWQARQIVDRIGAIRFAGLVGDPGHRLHRAWVELTRPDTGRRSWRLTSGPVRELLSIVRQRYPYAEQWMNPVRLAKWDEAAKASNGTYWWIAIVVIVTLLRVMLSGTHYPSTPPPVRASVEEVAQQTTGLGIAGVRAVNPALAAAIVQAVTDASRETSAIAIGQMLAEDWVGHGLSNLPDPVLLKLTRWDMDQMRALQDAAPAECDKVNLIRPGRVMASNIRDRRQELLRDVVLYAPDQPTADPIYRFVIPASVVDAMTARTKLSPATIKRALRGNETAEIRCKVQIALRETALQAPASIGRPLLRDLQPLIIHDGTETRKSGE